MSYFKNLPTLNFYGTGSVDSASLISNAPGLQKQISYGVTLRDLTIRYKIREDVISNNVVFYPYTWRDNDRPDTVAAKYYGNSSYWWVVFYSNKSFNYYFDFCLGQDQFLKYLLKKYVKTYYPNRETWQLTLNERNTLLNTLQIDISYYKSINDEIVDKAYYDSFSPTDPNRPIPITIYNDEEERNEAKREIKLLDKRYVQQVQSELESETKVRRIRGR